MTKKLQGYIKSCKIEKFYSTKDNRFIVAGYASKPIVDRVNDIVLPEAFQKSLHNFYEGKLRLPLLFEHSFPIGKIIEAEVRKDGFFVKAEVGSGWEEADKARKMIEQGVINYFSIGFIISEDGATYEEHEGRHIRIIKELDLVEISAVSVPANGQAIFEIDDVDNGKSIQIKGVKLLSDGSYVNDIPACQDALFSYTEKGIDVKVLEEDKDNIPEEQKAVCGKLDWPLADRDRVWDKSEAWRRIKQWVTDGTGDLNKLNVTKMKQIHFWYDEEEPENVSSYKLLFCDYIDNKVYAIPRAIFACAVVIQGGRGGLDIPEKDLAGVKRKVAHYYHRLNEKAPWEREKSYYLPEEVEPLVEIKLVEKLAKQKEQEQKQIQEEKLSQLLKAVSDLHKLIKDENKEGN